MSPRSGSDKYDDEAVGLQRETDARVVVVMVIGGKRGTGFSVHGELPDLLTLPERLRFMALSIERTIMNPGEPPKAFAADEASVKIAVGK